MNLVHRSVTKIGHKQLSAEGQIGLVERRLDLAYLSERGTDVDDNQSGNVVTARPNELGEVC